MLQTVVRTHQGVVRGSMADGFEELAGTHPPQEVADTMHAAWVAFATSGNPAWPQYDLRRRAMMRFDITSELVEYPYSAERMLWEDRR